MPVSVQQFLSTVFPEPLRPGQLLLRSKIRRSGRELTDWCFNLAQATRRIEGYRRTREVFFGTALHSRRQALARARSRCRRLNPAQVVGGEDTARALPALWAQVEIADAPSGPGGPPAAGAPTDRAAALARFDRLPQPPSILVWTGTGFEGAWLLEEPWELRTAEDRERARRTLARLRWALTPEVAAEPGPFDGLAARRHMPGTFRHLGGRRLEVTLEHFPLAGHVPRYSPADFEDLEEPPQSGPTALGPAPPWQAASRLPVWVTRPGEAWPDRSGLEPGDPPAVDFRPVWEGCAFLRASYTEQSTLEPPVWAELVDLLRHCVVPAAIDGRGLVHAYSAGHPGYTPQGTDEQLLRAQARDPKAPITCERIGRDLGAWDRFCSLCPHRGALDSPLDLAQPPADAPARPGPEVDTPSPETEDLGPSFVVPSPRLPLPASPLAPSSASPLATPAAGVEVWLRVPAQADPGAWSDLVQAIQAQGTTGELAPSGTVAPSTVPPSTVPPSLGAAHLVAGFEELLTRLGGPTTARAMSRALAENGPEAFTTLRTALRAYGVAHGAPPTAQELGYLLRSCRGRILGGREIVRADQGAGSATWVVRRARSQPPGDDPPATTLTQEVRP